MTSSCRNVFLCVQDDDLGGPAPDVAVTLFRGSVLAALSARVGDSAALRLRNGATHVQDGTKWAAAYRITSTHARGAAAHSYFPTRPRTPFREFAQQTQRNPHDTGM